MKRAMITGVSGFLGGHIVKCLKKYGFYTIGVDKRPLRNGVQPDLFIQADVNDLKFRDLLGVDFIFHGAWRTNIPDCQRHPESSTRDNIDMTISLLERAKEAGVKKFIFPSTASLYGHNSTPWKEDMPPNAIEPYSWQKLACEYACKMYTESYGLNTVIFRFFQIFGENQREDTALHFFLKAKEEGKSVNLTETMAQCSTRSGQRDFIYAGDVAEAIALSLQSEMGKGEIYNVASGETTSMEEIAKAIGNEVKWISKRPWEVDIHLGDNNKLRKFGWSPKIRVSEWLKQ